MTWRASVVFPNLVSPENAHDGELAQQGRDAGEVQRAREGFGHIVL